MYISTKDWKSYINKLRKLNDDAAKLIIAYVQKNGFSNTDALIRYCYAVVEKYGTGSAALAAAMYDATALMQGAVVPSAELAAVASYGDVAKTVHGVLKTSSNVDELVGAVTRWVKKAGCDTTLQNAVRDSHSNDLYSTGRKKYGKSGNTKHRERQRNTQNIFTVIVTARMLSDSMRTAASKGMILMQ